MSRTRWHAFIAATKSDISVSCVEDDEAMEWHRRHDRKQEPGELSLNEAILIEPRIKIVSVTTDLLNRLNINWDEIYGITDEQFEMFLAERLEAMGCKAPRLGASNRKDGGIDIVFETRGTVPFLGAVQAKHHRSARRSTGSNAIRDMQAALAMHPFDIGVVITNTTFTPDAEFVAKNKNRIIRLRDGEI